MPKILIVDDELSMREFLAILLEKDGYTTADASDGADALEIIRAGGIDLVVSDIKMPGMGGLDLLDETKKAKLKIPFIMITAYASPEDAVTAMKGGAYDYITKPFKVDEIKSVIKSALRNLIPSSSPESLLIPGIIGASPGMLKIYDLIRKIAPTHANVLIHGESGTGKELVARAMHQFSKVSGKPFVPIICSSIPESLFESELFGHVKGSFTGAHANKTGLFELADNGSVFLDEIGELSPLLQTKLLRVIQEREFKPVGGTETVKVDVRIISATNRNLEDEVVNGTFREDLYYRLSVVPIRVPPLRERKEDIPLLVDHFLKKYRARFGKDISALSSYALEVLMDYDFPGNVRELENIIERGVAMESSNIILPESLTISSRRRSREQEATPACQPGTVNMDQVYDVGLEETVVIFEKGIIEQALKDAKHSKMGAADLLKISFRSLRYKVQKYEIS